MSSTVVRHSRKSRSDLSAMRLAMSGGVRPHLLLVDDTATARELMKALLQQMGCSVDTAGDGNEAIARTRDSHYDAILMDIEMPVLDGLSAALEIRRLDEHAARTPIIALSALIADISSRPVLAAAFDATIVKPARRADLHRVLAPIIAIGQPAADAGLPDAVSADDPAPAPFDLNELKQVMHGLKPSQQRALQVIAADELTRLTAELGALVSAGSHTEINQIAHKIRGTAANFAAVHLSSLAAGLEAASATGLPAGLAAHYLAIERAAVDVITVLRSKPRRARSAKARRIG